MEFDMQVVGVLAFGLVAIVVMVWLFVRNPSTNIQSVQEQVAFSMETAKTLVMAAEQLYETGRLPADERFDWVKEQLEVSFGVDSEQAVALIEAAVYWMRHFVDKSNQPLNAQGLPR